MGRSELEELEELVPNSTGYESKRDPRTTLRTDRHRRQAPRRRFTGETKHDYSEEMLLKDLAEKYPMLNEYAKQIALARLATFNQNDWNNKMGWGEVYEFPENPYPDLFDVNNLGTRTAAAELLGMQNREELNRKMEEFDDWYEHRNEPQLRLKPMTEEDAKKDSIPWNASTDEYIRALVQNGVVRDERTLRNLAQKRLYEILKEDLKSGNPQYEMALEKLIGSKDEPYAPSDTTTLKEKQGPLGTDRTFDPRDDSMNFVANGFIPFTNRIWSDPELSYKASWYDWGLRGLGDAGMLALYALGPEALATRGALMTGLGSKYLAGTLSGIASKGAIRAGAGAGVGAAGWGAKNFVADPLMHNLAGVGTQRGPADLRDLGLEMLLNGSLNAMTTGLLRGGKASDNAFKVRKAMAPDKPSSVDYSDIKASFDAMKPKDVIDANSDKARALFEGTDLQKYRKKYPNEEMKIESNPEMVVNLNPKEGGPITMGAFTGLTKTGQRGQINKMTKTPGDPYFGFREAKNPRLSQIWARETPVYEELIPNASLLPDKTGVPANADLKNMVPTGFKRELMVEHPDEDLFFKRYMEQNKDFFEPYTFEEKQALRKEMKAAQVRESPESSRFGGGPEYIPGEKWAAEVRATRADPLNTDKANSGNMARHAQVTKKSTPGVRDKKTGDWSTSEKQQKDFAKAKKTMSRRKDMKIVGKDFLNNQTDYQQSSILGKASRIGGAVLNRVAPPVLTNNANLASDYIPHFVDFLGPRAEQIEYYEKE